MGRAVVRWPLIDVVTVVKDVESEGEGAFVTGTEREVEEGVAEVIEEGADEAAELEDGSAELDDGGAD
jgi:hypothetical protein